MNVLAGDLTLSTPDSRVERCQSAYAIFRTRRRVESVSLLESAESLVSVLPRDADHIGNFGGSVGFTLGDDCEVLPVVVFGLEVPVLVAVVLAHGYGLLGEAFIALLDSNPKLEEHSVRHVLG